MKKTTKKLISIFLSLLMVLSLIPMGTMTAYAINASDMCVCGHKAVEHYGTYYVNCNGASGCPGSMCSAGGFTYPEPVNPTTQITLAGKDYLYDSKYVTNYGYSLYCDIHKELAHKYSEWEAPSGAGYSKCLEAGHIKEATPEWVSDIISKVDAVADTLATAENEPITDILGDGTFEDFCNILTELEYSNEGSNYTIKGKAPSGAIVEFIVTLDADENVASVVQNAYFQGQLAMSNTYTPAPNYVEQILAFIEGKNCMQLLNVTDDYNCIAKGYDDTVDAIEAMADSITGVSNGGKCFSTAESNFALDEVHTNHYYDGLGFCEYCGFDPSSACGKCATCGHSNRYYNGSYCTKCKAEEGPCKNAGSPFASCVLTVGHTGSHVAHTHTFATTWSSDTTQHWHAATCGHSSEKDSLANHSGGSATCTTQAVCSTCGASYGELANHTYGTTGAARYTCTVCTTEDATKKAQAEAQDLADAKTAAKQALNTARGGSTDDSVTSVVSTYTQLIDAATTVAEVEDIQTEGVAAVSLASAKVKAWTSIINAVGDNGPAAAVEVRDNAIAALPNATSIEEVNTIKNEARAKIFLIVAQEDAKAAIADILGESEDEEAVAIANDAIAQIEAMTDRDAVKEYQEQVVRAIKDIVDPDFDTLKRDLKYDGTEVKLTKDYTREAAQFGIIIEDGQKVVIDLNGHTIDGAMDDAHAYGFLFYVCPGAELVITDSTDNEGVITGCTGYFDFTSRRYHGGVVKSFGTVTINGGTFTGNVASQGGVVENSGKLTITGGVFTDNKAYTQGGVISNVDVNTELLITGGTFTNNTAPYGGAIINHGPKSCVIAGGTFTDNTATKMGGGILQYSASLTIGGSVVVKDNKVGEDINNLEYVGGTVALADTAFTEDADIGVTITAETDTLIAEGATLDTLKALKSDNADKMFTVEDGAVKRQNIADHVHSFGTTGADRYTCQSCGTVDDAKELEAAKADAKAAIKNALGESENEKAIETANNAKTAIDTATSIEDVNKIKTDAVKAINNILHPAPIFVPEEEKKEEEKQEEPVAPAPVTEETFVTKAIVPSKSKIKVTVNKVAGVDGYQIQYGRVKSFKKSKKTITTKKTVKTIKVKKPGKKYYVRVRSFKIVNGKKVYSNWSKIESIKTK